MKRRQQTDAQRAVARRGIVVMGHYGDRQPLTTAQRSAVQRVIRAALQRLAAA